MATRSRNLIATAAAFLLFAVLVAFPLLQVALRINFSAPMPAELIPTALFSLKQAAWSLFASLVVGLPLGAFYARGWTRSLRGFAIASFSLPVLIVIGTVALLLRGQDFRFGLFAVVVAHAFLNAPWIALATAEGIRSVPRAWTEAARTLGASPTQVFARIEFPWIARGVAVASAQVFALCLMSFAIVMVLGGGPPVSNLETEIFAAVRGGGLDLTKAAWFAMTQLLLAAVPLLAVVGLRRPVLARDSLAARNAPLEDAKGPAGFLALAIAATWLFLPGALFARNITLSSLGALAANADLHAAILVSLKIGVSTAAASLAFGAVFAFAARDSRITRILAGVPVGLSALLISLGFFLAYSDFVDPFEGSLLGMVAVQAALFLPFTLRFFLPLVDEETSGPRRDLRQTARTLGATPFVAWKRLEWPRWWRAGLRLGSLVFVWSFSELASASFFGSERLTTVGVLIVRWFAQYRFEEVNTLLFGIYVFSSAVLILVGLGAGEDST